MRTWLTQSASIWGVPAKLYKIRLRLSDMVRLWRWMAKLINWYQYQILFGSTPVNSGGLMLTFQVAVAKHYTLRCNTWWHATLKVSRGLVNTKAPLSSFSCCWILQQTSSAPQTRPQSRWTDSRHLARTLRMIHQRILSWPSDNGSHAVPQNWRLM